MRRIRHFNSTIEGTSCGLLICCSQSCIWVTTAPIPLSHHDILTFTIGVSYHFAKYYVKLLQTKTWWGSKQKDVVFANAHFIHRFRFRWYLWRRKQHIWGHFSMRFGVVVLKKQSWYAFSQAWSFSSSPWTSRPGARDPNCERSMAMPLVGGEGVDGGGGGPAGCPRFTVWARARDAAFFDTRIAIKTETNHKSDYI